MPEGKKKRNRIKKERVDINNTPGTNVRPSSRVKEDRKPRLRKPIKVEISEEDVELYIGHRLDGSEVPSFLLEGKD